MTKGSMKTLITNRATLLSAVMTLLVAVTVALAGHGAAPPASAQQIYIPNGLEGVHSCGYAITDENTQVLGHIIQISWGAATDDEVEGFMIKVIAGTEAVHTGADHPGGVHTGSKDGGVHQFNRIPPDEWPGSISSGWNDDYWIYNIWFIAIKDGEPDPNDSGYTYVDFNESGKRNCDKIRGNVAPVPVFIQGTPVEDRYVEPQPPASVPSPPEDFEIELIESGPEAGHIKLTWQTAPANEEVFNYRISRRVKDGPDSYFLIMWDKFVYHEYPTHEGDDDHWHIVAEDFDHQAPEHGNHQHPHEHGPNRSNRPHRHAHAHEHPHKLWIIDRDTDRTSVRYEYIISAYNAAGYGPGPGIRGLRKKSPVNHSPTGAPYISGLLWEDSQTLTAGIETGFVQDRNGMYDVDDLQYRWERLERGSSNVENVGAGETYTTGEADAGKWLRAVVSFTDDDGYTDNEATSELHYIEHDPPMVAVIDQPDSHDGSSFEFSLLFTEEPDANAARIMRAVQATNATVTAARKRWDTEWVVTVNPRQRDVTLSIDETPIFGCSASDAICSLETHGKRLYQGDSRTVPYVQAQREETPNSPATGQPTISGTPESGQVLTASTSNIQDANGLNGATFSYQWQRYDGSSRTDIAGATSRRYTVTDDDEGKQLSVTVSFTDDDGYDESRTSADVYVQPPAPLYGGFDSNTVPASHDGSTAFTFEIRFSEKPRLSYVNVRDHVLQVTGGDVTHVKRAHRQGEDRNTRWQIKVTPDGDDDIKVVMPPTTGSCSDPSAVCTPDGRKKLSNQSSVTVKGP